MSARANISNKTNDKQMIGQMAIAKAFPGFNDLRRTVTLVFLLMDHSLYHFLPLAKKCRKSID